MAGVPAARRWMELRGADPLRPVFRLLTSVRFAIVLVLIVAVAALLGVIFPQAPEPIRLSPDAFDAWTEDQRHRYGPFADLLRFLGLFNVFHTVWFNGLFFLLLGAVAVCTYNRFGPTLRMVRRPVRRVNDRFFDHAHARALLTEPLPIADVDAGCAPAATRSERLDERDGTVYLLADRASPGRRWRRLPHLSLILYGRRHRVGADRL
ncbi:MAG: cytochrome c biogenesis protein ResB [Dehalococcoidia bacterium]